MGEAPVDATAQGTFSLDETTDVGEETGTTVAEDVTIETSRFNGRIRFVQIDVRIDDKDHFLSPDERFSHRHGAAVTANAGVVRLSSPGPCHPARDTLS